MRALGRLRLRLVIVGRVDPKELAELQEVDLPRPVLIHLLEAGIGHLRIDLGAEDALHKHPARTTPRVSPEPQCAEAADQAARAARQGRGLSPDFVLVELAAIVSVLQPPSNHRPILSTKRSRAFWTFYMPPSKRAAGKQANALRPRGGLGFEGSGSHEPVELVAQLVGILAVHEAYDIHQLLVELGALRTPRLHRRRDVLHHLHKPTEAFTSSWWWW